MPRRLPEDPEALREGAAVPLTGWRVGLESEQPGTGPFWEIL